MVDPNRGVDPTIAAKFEGIAVEWVSGQPYLLLPLTGTDSDHPNAAPGGGVAEGAGASFAIIVYFLKKSVEDVIRSPANPQCGHLHEALLKVGVCHRLTQPSCPAPTAWRTMACPCLCPS